MTGCYFPFPFAEGIVGFSLCMCGGIGREFEKEFFLMFLTSITVMYVKKKKKLFNIKQFIIYEYSYIFS
jgi:hypothetical protein